MQTKTIMEKIPDEFFDTSNTKPLDGGLLIGTDSGFLFEYCRFNCGEYIYYIVVKSEKYKSNFYPNKVITKNEFDKLKLNK